MLADMHVHSTFSFDGDDEAEVLITEALKKGIKILAITDHLDVNEYDTEKYKQSILLPEANKTLPVLKEKYKDKITVLYGVELGQSVHDKARTLSLLDGKPYDVILGSVHAVRGEQDFYYIDYEKKDCSELFGRYFSEILETVECGGIDVIAHLTYPLRYLIGRGVTGYDFSDLSEHDDVIDEILRLAVQKNIALEINTGGLRNEKYRSSDPPLKYIKRFNELGGEIITLGSDAHRSSDMIKGFDEAREIAVAAGFENAAYFVKRKPHFYKL